MMLRFTLALLVALPAVANAQGGVAVLGDNLSDAKARYAAATNQPRRDCDPAGSGRWICASFNNPTLTDTGGSGADLPAPTQPSQPVTPAAVGAAVVGSSLHDASSRYARATSQRRIDCDPVGDGRWICASFSNPTLADVSGVPVVSGPAPVPAPSPAPSAPVQDPNSSSGLKLQAEDLPLGEGWRVESSRSGFEGRGYAIWRGPNLFSEPGSGLTNLQFEVPRSGNYQIRIRARAVSPSRSDLSNDTFFRFPGGQWTKVFTTGRDNWQTGGAGDRNNQKFPLRAVLQSGVVTVQMSGRSTRHAIDFVELVPVR